VGTRGLARLRPRDLAGREVRLERWAEGSEPLPSVLEVLTPSGGRCWISCSYARVPAGDGRPRRLVLTSRDVTKELERAEQALRRSAARFRLVHPHDLLSLRTRFGDYLAGEARSASFEFRCLAADGTWRHLEALASNLLDDPAVAGVVLNTRDLTERKRAEGLLWAETRQAALARGLRAAWAMPIMTAESSQVLGTVTVYFDRPRSAAASDMRLLEAAADLADIAIERSRAQTLLAHQAAHDALTGLPNRVFFLDRAAHALDRTRRSRSSAAAPTPGPRR
jgi:hypothetical protein